MPTRTRPKPLLEHAAAEAEARRLVDEALNTGADALVLDGLRINRLPDGLKALAPQLKRLSLANCRRISDLTPLRALAGLEVLDLSGCPQVDDLKALEALPSLRTLSLVGCWAITDLGPLRRLIRLESLDLSNCIRLTDLSALEGMSALQSLQLDSCWNIDGFTSLASLTGLQSLALYGCRTFADLSVLAPLPKLRDLNLGWCGGLTDLAGLASITGLTSLDISSNGSLHDLSPLAALTSLQKLNLAHGPELQDLSALEAMRGLRSLNASDLPRVDDLSAVASLSALETLGLSGWDGKRASAAIRPLQGLKSLQLYGCVGLRDLSALAGMSGLRSLNLRNCQQLQDLSALAVLTSLRDLDLGGCDALENTAPLATLTELQTLDLSDCRRISDLSFLGALPQLESLALSGCAGVDDLSPLRTLKQLNWLAISGCHRVTDVSPLQSSQGLQHLDMRGCNQIVALDAVASWPGLESLYVTGCTGPHDLSAFAGLHQLRILEATGVGKVPLSANLVAQAWPRLTYLGCDAVQSMPRELQSGDEFDDCLPQLERWHTDLHTSGSAPCDTLKLFVLGNGRAGKTQIVRRLQGLPYDASVPSTHGVRTTQLPLLPDLGLNAQVWDFGGQDIYLGTHSLFLDDRAIYLLVWTPALENDDCVVDNGITMHNKHLAHWLAHVRAMVGQRAPVLVVQSQCDRASQRLAPPVPEQHGFDWLQRTACSAQQPDGLDRLWPELRDAARLLHERHGDTLLPRSWVAVRDQLRAALQEGKRVLPRADYDALCSEHDVGEPDATLAYLHQAGEVFSLPGVFNGDVVLDQAWALDGLYALLHRQQVLPILRQSRGHFTRELLGALIWDAQGFSLEEQHNFLSMMQRCGVCFPLGDGNYLAPDCLPGRDAVQPRVDALWRGQPPAVQLTLAYPYLHDGLLRTLVSTLGEAAGLEAVYWRYGVAFYDARAGSAVLVESSLGDDPQRPFAGTVRLAAAEARGRELLERLARQLIKAVALAEPPAQQWSDAAEPPPRRRPDHGEDDGTPVIDAVQPPVAPDELPAVHVSYAGGGDSEAWVDKLEQELADECTWRRDKRVMRPGDWISTFIGEIADARCVVLVVSNKSLESAYCMRELLGLFQTSNGQKSRLLERIVPVPMPDAAIDSTPQRLARVRHWRERYDANVAAAQGLDVAELGQAFVHEQQLITEFRTRVADILAWVGDVLIPRSGLAGSAPSVQAVAALVRERLKR